VVRYLDVTVAEACLRSARDLLLAAYGGAEFDVAAEILRLRGIAERCALGPSSMAIVNAARQRAIPWRRIDQVRSLVQLGHGTHQRRIWTAETDRSGAISPACSSARPVCRCPWVDAQRIPTTPGTLPNRSARPSWSSRSMPTTAVACSST
jgi:cyanophycin synthetase